MQNISHCPSRADTVTLDATTDRETFYEFPLHAQVRTYLRIEHLIKRIEAHAGLKNEVESELYFQSLFGLCALLSQVHVRSDLVKDLTRQREKFKAWQQNPDIDKTYLDDLYTQSFALQQQLLQAPRLAQSLRDDHFLVSFRQRFEVPAGSCSFDVPHLHYWLSSSSTDLQSHTQRWNKELTPIHQALAFWLKIVRQTGAMQTQVIKKGIYQQDAPDSHLVQIKINAKHGVYPLVSNYKSRFSIRLLPFSEEKTVAEQIEVSLAAL